MINPKLSAVLDEVLLYDTPDKFAEALDEVEGVYVQHTMEQSISDKHTVDYYTKIRILRQAFNDMVDIKKEEAIYFNSRQEKRKA